jgi:hypothetical protein
MKDDEDKNLTNKGEKTEFLTDNMQYFMNSAKESIENLQDVQSSAIHDVWVLMESKLRYNEPSDMMRPLFDAYHHAKCSEEYLLKFLHEMSQEFTG